MSFLNKIRNVVQNEGTRGIRQVLQKEGTKRFAQDLSAKIVPETFQFTETRRYGLPALVSAIAVDPVQGLLAAGTYKGVIAVTGAIELTCYLELEEGIAIKSMAFQPGLPVLVVLDAKNAITVFDLIKQQRLFVRNARSVVTCMELLPGSNWLFHGLKDGSIDVFDVYRGQAVPYRIPNILPEGPTKHSMVISIQAHPRDNNQLLIAYNTGVVLWNLQQKSVIRNYIYEIPPGAMGGFSPDAAAIQQPRFPHVTVISWRPDGQGFVSGYDDGCIVFWDIKNDRPTSARTIHETQVNIPGVRSLSSQTLPVTQFVPIYQLSWCLHKNQQDTTLVVAGGSSNVDLFGLHLFEYGAKPDLRYPPRRQETLPMESDIMDFVVLPSESPWFNGAYDPIAIIAVTSRGGIKSYGFKSPYPLLRLPSCLQWLEPKVILTKMVGNLPTPIHQRLLYGSDPKKAQAYYGTRLPLRGGQPALLDENRLSKDILITVHADASVRFWDGARMLSLAHLNVELAPLFHKNQAQITAIEFSANQRAFACGFANGHWVYCQIEEADAIARRDSFHHVHKSDLADLPPQLPVRPPSAGSSSSQGPMPVQVSMEELLSEDHLGASHQTTTAKQESEEHPSTGQQARPAALTDEALSTEGTLPAQPKSPTIHAPSPPLPTAVTQETESSLSPSYVCDQMGGQVVGAEAPESERIQHEPSPALPPRPLIQEVSLSTPTETQAIFKSFAHLGRVNLITMSDCGLVAVVDEFYTISITDSKTRQVLHIEDLKVVTWKESTSSCEDAQQGQHATPQGNLTEAHMIEQKHIGVQITSLRFVISTTSDQDKKPGLLLVAGSNEGVFIIFSITPSIPDAAVHDQSGAPPSENAQTIPPVARIVRKVETFQIKEKARSVHCAMINVLAPGEVESDQRLQQQSHHLHQQTTMSSHPLPPPPPPEKDDVRRTEQDLPGRASMSLSDSASVVSQDTVSSATSRKSASTSNTFMSSIKEAQDKMKVKAQERLAYFVCVTDRGIRLHMNCTSRRIHKVEVTCAADDPVTAMLSQQQVAGPSDSSSQSYHPTIVAAGVISYDGSVAVLCLGDLGQLMLYSVPKLELISPKHLRLPIVTGEGRERLSESIILSDGRILVPILKFEYRVYSLFGDDRVRLSATGEPIVSNHDQSRHTSHVAQRNQLPPKYIEVYDHGIQIPPRPTPQVKSGWFGLGSSSDEAPSQEDLDQLLGGAHYHAENPMLKQAGVKGAPGSHQADDNRQQQAGVAGMMDQTIQALGERGEKLDQLGDKTAQMSAASQDFLKAVRELNAKNANKKWYEL